jgi:two-component system, chemotaxis family, response regulator Rcp1
VLLVEDNAADVRMMREALKLAGIAHRLWVAADGDEALRFLHRQEGFAHVPRPDIMILDLNLPRISGHAVLGAAKIDPELSSIPVVVLTSSRAARDASKSYDLKADAFITKPVGLHMLAGEMRVINGLVR